ncbi:hypothetical protein HMPREF0204_11734 [Chryseobacterium gleum ATCC 35910]|uniref:Uncharacterized protein n=1 Tax=Chryseobacterium gleum ATCC 35910 TaxID=525257 RepID=A0ABN0AT18_CHRGE|nr:hypothetical protein HMPREF0204_11734 [Chryseobacterium gleum ATCC 35910]
MILQYQKKLCKDELIPICALINKPTVKELVLLIYLSFLMIYDVLYALLKMKIIADFI